MLALSTRPGRGSRCRGSLLRKFSRWFGQGITGNGCALGEFLLGGFPCGGSPRGSSSRRRRGRGSGRFRWLDSDFGLCRLWCLRGRTSVRGLGRCGAGGGFAQKSHKKVSSIATAASGHCGKLFAMPFYGEERSDGEGSLDPNAGAGERSVFEGCGGAIVSSGLIVPGDLGHSPHYGSGFEATDVHAMIIGWGRKEFSDLRAWVELSLRRWCVNQNGTASRDGSLAERQPSCAWPVRVGPAPTHDLEQAHESAGGQVGGEEVGVFDSGGAG
jgi:hypothetical protein